MAGGVFGLADALRAIDAGMPGKQVTDDAGDAGVNTDLGAELAPTLHERELEYLWRAEWARSADDVLWRRTKLGMLAGAADVARVQDWFDRRTTA